MENSQIEEPEIYDGRWDDNDNPPEPEIFPSGVVIQAGAEGYELLLFGGTVSAEEAIKNERPTIIARSAHTVLGTAFRNFGNSDARWYDTWLPEPAAVFPFTPPTKFVGFYSEDHPEVLR